MSFVSESSFCNFFYWIFYCYPWPIIYTICSSLVSVSLRRTNDNGFNSDLLRRGGGGVWRLQGLSVIFLSSLSHEWKHSYNNKDDDDDDDNDDDDKLLTLWTTLRHWDLLKRNGIDDLMTIMIMMKYVERTFGLKESENLK